MTSFVIDADPRGRAFQQLLARDMIRLRDPETGHWLHLAGTGTTPDLTWSWLGHRHQADTLRARWLAEGRDWSFVALHRDDTGQGTAPLADDRRDWMEAMR